MAEAARAPGADHPEEQPRSPAAHLVSYRWQRGVSANPSGRTPMALSLAQLARDKTRNGEELLEFFAGVMRGEPMKRPQGLRPQWPSPELRLHAAEWLADRGWGRAKEIIELRDDVTHDRARAFTRLSEEDRTALRAILERAFSTEAPALSEPRDE
jgi:hypothetical protein